MAAILTDNWHLYPPPHPDPRYTDGPPNSPSVARSTNIAQFLLELTFFRKMPRQVKMSFFVCEEEERNYFLSPVTTARKRKLLSQLFTKYTSYSSPAHSPVIRNGKIWRPNGRTTLSETMKYQRERDTPDTQPQNHCQTWDLNSKRPNFERHRTRWKKLWNN